MGVAVNERIPQEEASAPDDRAEFGDAFYAALVKAEELSMYYQSIVERNNQRTIAVLQQGDQRESLGLFFVENSGPQEALKALIPFSSGLVTSITLLNYHYQDGKVEGVGTVSYGRNKTLRAENEMALVDVAQECSVENWDGDGAKPVERGTLVAALAFLRSLPANLPEPDVAAEPGGEIGFEWRKGDDLIAVTIDRRSRVNYAAVFGRSTEHGSMDFVDNISKRLMDLIESIAS